MTSRFGKVVLATALLATVGLVGCGGGSDDATGSFVGLWQYTSGTENLQCAMIGVNNISQLQGQKETFARGVGVPLINSDPNSNCTLNFNVAGSTATAIGGQTCMTTIATDQGSVPTTLTVTSAVFTVTGTTGHLSESVNFVINSGGQSINCSQTGSGDLLRLSM
jgi:hypothetical protein